jgi:protein-S-isoprenylcysteine O-methyltransferase Ste14
MKKLNYLGIGPHIGLVVIPLIVAEIILTSMYPEIFGFSRAVRRILFYSGIVLLAGGFGLYIATARALLKGLKETRLITWGAYALCQNPLYACFILFLIPGLAFVINSWLVLTSSLVAYVLFRVFIKREYEELKEFFGDEYISYASRTPRFFPVPFTRKS